MPGRNSATGESLKSKRTSKNSRFAVTVMPRPHQGRINRPVFFGITLFWDKAPGCRRESLKILLLPGWPNYTLSETGSETTSWRRETVHSPTRRLLIFIFGFQVLRLFSVYTSLPSLILMHIFRKKWFVLLGLRISPLRRKFKNNTGMVLRP